jgi:hypothetical protein
MTFAEMRAETYRRLEESATGQVFFTDADVDDALNEGYEELSDASEWFEVSLTIDVLHTRPYYDLRTVFPYDVLAPGPAFNETSGRWLEPCEIRDIDRMARQPETTSSQAQRLLQRSLWWVGYWPILQSETGAVTQYATCVPDRMALDEDVPGFPEAYHRGCVEYALAVLLPAQGMVSEALAAWGRYDAIENALIAWKRGRVAAPMTRGYAYA